MLGTQVGLSGGAKELKQVMLCPNNAQVVETQ